jgi:hypothetical protein
LLQNKQWPGILQGSHLNKVDSAEAAMGKAYERGHDAAISN